MELGKSLNQSPQGGLEKIEYTSSNGSPGNCCKVSNKYLIGHMLGEQNRGSTNMPFDSTHGSLALKAYQQNLYLEYYY